MTDTLMFYYLRKSPQNIISIIVDEINLYGLDVVMGFTLFYGHAIKPIRQLAKANNA